MKVSVLMPAYNHESTISQAIESFLSQQCGFETELLIGDDASADKTWFIANEFSQQFPDKIKLITHRSNFGLLKNYKSLTDIAKGEYFAILESDDYWTDNQKLQKQIDFLDSNPDAGISFTRWYRLKNNGLTLRGEDIVRMMKKYPDSLYERFLLRNILKSPTVVFRRSLYEKYCNIDDYVRLDFNTFDYPVWLSLIRHSGVHFLNEATAAYRYLETSISNNRDLTKKIVFEDKISEIRRYIISLYGSGNLSLFRISNRETLVKARHAFRSKKVITSVTILMGGFFGNCRRALSSAVH